jgi:hypothetical protein
MRFPVLFHRFCSALSSAFPAQEANSNSHTHQKDNPEDHCRLRLKMNGKLTALPRQANAYACPCGVAEDVED